MAEKHDIFKEAICGYLMRIDANEEPSPWIRTPDCFEVICKDIVKEVAKRLEDVPTEDLRRIDSIRYRFNFGDKND